MIESVINGKKTTNLGFPKLMRATTSGTVVLFKTKNIGTVIYQGLSSNQLGYHSISWAMEDFEDFHDSVIIKNKRP